jgi:hypothetical protein
LAPCVGLYPVLCMKSGDGNLASVPGRDTAGRVVFFMAVRTYVIMDRGAGSPSCGVCAHLVFCVVNPEFRSDISRCRIQLSWVLSLCWCCAVSVN